MCEWFVSPEGNEECDTPANWTSLAVAEAGGDPYDGICLYATALGRSGCAALDGVEECSQSPNCSPSLSESECILPIAIHALSFGCFGQIVGQL